MDEDAVGLVSDALALTWSRVGTRIRMSVELDAYMAERLAMKARRPIVPMMKDG